MFIRRAPISRKVGNTETEELFAIAIKQYRFRLQAVLEYRSDQVDLIQQKVAEEETKRIQILNRIREFDQAIEQAFADQQKALSEPTLNPTQASGFSGYVWRLKQLRFQEHHTLQQQEHRIRQIREELKAALIKKKSLEVLKDKEQKRYRKALEKAEEETLADIIQSRLHRKTS